ncbi:hypothetical protein NQU59_11555 [Acinetobacter colistiniresistens]|nr:hypothetical protein [Acinetobacter colistiniresistens]UUM26336.1 hypothetical protein NQU59_11555 [Acinetobacter colistiniresistens]
MDQLKILSRLGLVQGYALYDEIDNPCIAKNKIIQAMVLCRGLLT